MRFRDFVLQVAIWLGLSDETGATNALPDDQAHLDLCKRIVNRAYKKFLQRDARWTFCEAPVQIMLSTAATPDQVDGEHWRYRLPEWARGGPKTRWRYIDSQAWPSGVTPVTWDQIATRMHVLDESGPPVWAATRETPIASGHPLDAPRRWEVVFYPKPDSVYTVEGDFRVVPYDLQHLDERHVAGPEHDQTILELCRYEAAMEDENQMDQEEAKRDAEQAVAFSLQIDRQKRPRRLGKFHDPAAITDTERSRRPRGLVTHMDGVAIPFE